jgi:dTDP-4-amino-4,6-dideoxygalactose transaminase
MEVTAMIANRQVPLLDLRAQHQTIRDEVMREVVRVIDTQKFILGEDVELLERDIAAYCGTHYAIGCASGSDALLLALMALGVGPGDAVLTTPYSFFATAGSIVQAGARPVFVDVEESTFNLDVRQVAAALDARPRIRAILPVHLFGACADLDALREVSRGLPLIEDAAQSIGAEYQGRRAGSIGAIGCFSFFPSKNLGGYGDGGILTTDDQELAVRLRALRVHGSRVEYIHEWVGRNSRLDALQAAVLRVKLRHLDSWTAGRQTNAALYREAFARRGAPVTLPAAADYQTRHIYNQFTIRAPRRDELRAWLRENGIGSAIYYPVPLHLQQCFAELGYRPGDLPVSERLAAEALSLPVYPELDPADIEYVADAVTRFYNRP